MRKLVMFVGSGVVLLMAVNITTNAASSRKATTEAQAGLRDASNIDFTALSGKWTGFIYLYQRGTCQIRPGTAVSSLATEGMLTFSADGSFTASFANAPSFILNKTIDWTGHIDSELTLALKRPAWAYCDGTRRDYTVHYTGSVTTKKNRYHLEVQGEDAACPDSNCVFKRIVRLTKKRP
jgi:hypothetical protein